MCQKFASRLGIKDDENKVTSIANNREYSGNYTLDGVKDCKIGKYVNPATVNPATTLGNPDWHSHPSGIVNGFGWQEPPSKQDIQTIGRKNSQFVYSMGNGTIYKYTKKGVIATLPISLFR